MPSLPCFEISSAQHVFRSNSAAICLFSADELSALVYKCVKKDRIVVADEKHVEPTARAIYQRYLPMDSNMTMRMSYVTYKSTHTASALPLQDYCTRPMWRISQTQLATIHTRKRRDTIILSLYQHCGLLWRSEL